MFVSSADRVFVFFRIVVSAFFCEFGTPPYRIRVSLFGFVMRVI